MGFSRSDYGIGGLGPKLIPFAGRRRYIQMFGTHYEQLPNSFELGVIGVRKIGQSEFLLGVIIMTRNGIEWQDFFIAFYTCLQQHVD